MYSPKIKEDLVRRLYRMKHSSDKKIPMTRMVNEAVQEYIDKNEEVIRDGPCENYNQDCISSAKCFEKGIE